MKTHATTWLVATSLLGTLFASPVTAATLPVLSRPYPTRMALESHVLTSPEHLVRRESGEGKRTSWLPLWYLFEVLKPLGLHSSWDGRVWNLTMPSKDVPARLSLQRSPPKGAIFIERSGRPIESASGTAHRDFRGRVMTTHIAIRDLMQVLDGIGVTSIWRGTTCSLSALKATSVTKMQVVKAFMRTLHMTPDRSGVNPFDDVSIADWPFVHAVLTKGYFSPDSPTHFGASEVISLKTVDHAYQVYVGIPNRDLSWNAGGHMVAWAGAVGLNAGVTQGTLTALGEKRVMDNLANLYRGYSKGADGTFRVWFEPYDAKTAFLHNPDVTAKVASLEQENSIRLADRITFSVHPHGRLTFLLPGIADTDSMEITAGSLFNKSGNHTEFSVNGGATWTTASGFYGYDSRDPANGGRKTPMGVILVRTQGHAQIAISAIFGRHDTTFAELGFTPSATNRTIALSDHSGQPTWTGQ